MGPVSFERIGVGFDRSRLLRLATALADAGIRAELIDTSASPAGSAALLVRSQDLAAARTILDAIAPSGDEDEQDTGPAE